MEYSNFDQVLTDLQKLNQAIETIRQKIVTETQIAYISQDARHVALEGLQSDISACGMWMHTLISLKGKYRGTWNAEYQKLIGTALSSDQAEDLMLEYLRNTLTTKIHFKIESLFSNLLKALSATPRKSGFWHISEAMLKEADLPTNGPEKNTLTAFANLRNSYHANGIHSNEFLSVDIHGTMFEFSKGWRVECASWKHIVVIMQATICVLDTILFSDKVSRLRSEIQDDFARGDS
jgi:hypothetical protein